MKNFMLFVCICMGLTTQAQNNIFLGRDFWKTQPSIEQVKQKIAEGNSPTEMNQWSFDAPAYAIISHAPTETIKYLLGIEGNEVDKITHDGRNYLLWAAYAGNLDLMNFLIEKGSDIKWVDDHGYDIVTFTAAGGNTNPQLYELYKKHGLVLKDSKRKGANALLLAAPSVNNITDLDYFIKNGMSWKDKDNLHNNLFLAVAAKGNVKVLKQLVEKGISHKTINKNGENAVLVAAKGARRHTNSLETFKYLTTLGINPLKITPAGNNALHYLAMSNPNWDVFEFFLNQGLDANQANEKGQTPYLLSLEYNNSAISQHLQELTKDFNLQTKDGYAALSYAVANLSLNTVKTLLEKGVDTNILTDKNESLLTILFENFNPKKEKEFKQIYALLIQKSVKPSIHSENGNTLYHIAVQKQAPTLVDYASKLGVNIDKMNAEGLTPLHLAAMTSKDLKMLKSLMSHGANGSINTEFGEDAAVLALENELLNVTMKDLEFLKASNH